MDEPDAKAATVAKFKELISKIMEEENTTVIYPYSTSSSAVPITTMARMPNTFIELKRYLPSIKPPLKDSDLVYGQVYIGTNTEYADWNTNFLEWTKDNGHGVYKKFVQDERLTVVGYLLYTHKMSNSPWYQSVLSKKSTFPIAARFRKISGQKPKDRAAVHLECSRTNHEQVKAFLRIHCSKNTKPPFLTGFPVIFIPDKMHISNKHSKSGAQIVAKRQGNLVTKIILRTSWSIYGIDMVNKQHKISMRTMISRIMREDENGTMRQLFHSVDSTWNDEGTIFGWHPQFDDQAQIVMTGLLPYLKSMYGDSVESYFSPGAVGMQSKQRWDQEKGGVIGEDDEFISSTSGETSWWDEDLETDGNQRTQRITIDAKNVVTRDVPDAVDSNSLPSLHTKADEGEEDDGAAMNDLLNAPPPVRRTNVNDDSTITSNLTMDTRMDTVESNIGNLDNSVNHMTHVLTMFMARMERSQGTNLSPAAYLQEENKQNKNTEAVSKNTENTKVTEDTILGDQFQ